MRLQLFLLCVVATVVAVPTIATAQPLVPYRYPTVYGDTGRPYGPSQAHYQYQRRYGRPWNGFGGRTFYVPTGRSQFAFGGSFGCFSPGYHFHAPFGYAYRSYYPVSNYYFNPYVSLQFSPFPYYVSQWNTTGIGYFAVAPYEFRNPVVATPRPVRNKPLKPNAVKDVGKRWKQPIDLNDVKQTVTRPVVNSTADAKLRSLRMQARADVWMRKRQYVNAYNRYKAAIDHAADRPELYFRQALSLVAMGDHSKAVKLLVRGLEVDPDWPKRDTSLDDVFGPDNESAKVAFIERAAMWVKQDVHDPDRLFLMGVLLYFDDDARRSTPFFEAAWRLSNGGPHLAAFLELAKPNRPATQPAEVERQPEQNNEPIPKSPTAPVDPDPLAPLLVPQKPSAATR